ncbi:unnamed protein product, partial [Ceratitis capitata]
DFQLVNGVLLRTQHQEKRRGEYVQVFGVCARRGRSTDSPTQATELTNQTCRRRHAATLRRFGMASHENIPRILVLKPCAVCLRVDACVINHCICGVNECKAGGGVVIVVADFYVVII